MRAHGEGIASKHTRSPAHRCEPCVLTGTELNAFVRDVRTAFFLFFFRRFAFFSFFEAHNLSLFFFFYCCLSTYCCGAFLGLGSFSLFRVGFLQESLSLLNFPFFYLRLLARAQAGELAGR